MNASDLFEPHKQAWIAMYGNKTATGPHIRLRAIPWVSNGQVTHWFPEFTRTINGVTLTVHVKPAVDGFSWDARDHRGRVWLAAPAVVDSVDQVIAAIEHWAEVAA